MKKALNFKPLSYRINKIGDVNSVEIEGQKLRPPSKRITLNQSSIKVQNAKIIYKYKKGNVEYEVSRINHIKSFGEVRLHTNNILYPGNYVVTLEYSGELDDSSLGEQAT
jgi:hypothetical protein